MKVLEFSGLLTDQGWLTPAFVSLDEQGCVTEISGQPSVSTDEKVSGYAIPGFKNSHSHAFQYAMAGLAEHRSSAKENDNFWSWRETMYELALKVSPEQIETIATTLYIDLLKNGYTSVVEFHYLHKDIHGKNYEQKTEIAQRLIAAAKKSGIHLTLVPIFYQKGDFGQEASNRQRRFIFNHVDEYLYFLQETSNLCASEQTTCGLGAHSLRAVPIDSIQKLNEFNHKNLPFHLHISEQKKEVDACLAFSGQRPVEYFFDHVDVSEKSNFHFVHATHLSDKELHLILKNRINVVLCPSTEANLGDGIFPLQTYHRQKGRWSIGSDSHICRDPLEELRWLDYGQRLLHQRRTPLCPSANSESGHELYQASQINGVRSCGHNAQNFFQVGQPFDALVFESDEFIFSSLPKEKWLSSLIFSHSQIKKRGILVSGQWVIENGRHHCEEEVKKLYSHCLKSLFS